MCCDMQCAECIVALSRMSIQVLWIGPVMIFLQAFKHAKQMADAEAARRKTPVKLASADEIRRVLNAMTDYDCLQVKLTRPEVSTTLSGLTLLATH